MKYISLIVRLRKYHVVLTLKDLTFKRYLNNKKRERGACAVCNNIPQTIESERGHR